MATLSNLIVRIGASTDDFDKKSTRRSIKLNALAPTLRRLGSRWR